MSRIVLLGLLGLLLNIQAKAIPQGLLSQSYLEVKESLDSIYQGVDPIKRPLYAGIVNAWVIEAEEQDALVLANQLRLVVIKYLLIDSTVERLNPWIQEQIDNIIVFATEAKSHYLLADAWQIKGHFLRIRDQYGKSLEAHHMAYNVYKSFSPKEHPYIYFYIYRLSLAYFRLGNYRNTIRYLNEILSSNPTEEETNLNALYNTLGLSYRYLEKYDSAEFYFQKILQRAEAKEDEVWIGIASGNIGITYYLNQKYDEAIPLLETDIRYGALNSNWVEAAKSLLIRAEIHFIKGEYQDAEKRLLLAKSYLYNWGPLETKQWDVYQGVSALFAKVYAQKGRYDLAYAYSDTALSLRDTLSAIFNITKLSNAQQKIDLLTHKLQEEEYTHEENLHKLIQNVLIVGFLVLIIIGGLLINRQMLKQRNLKSELDIASKRLADFTSSIHQKSTLIEQATAEVNRLKPSVEKEEDTDIILDLREAILLTDEQWDDFRALFEKVHEGFFYKLNKAIPGLTPAEIRFLALVKLQLSPKEMAGMLGISDNAIRLYRHRLRKKLNLRGDQTVEGLVEFAAYQP